ncbi:hypothetical protein D7V20_04170 [Acinetobacter rongchengensis]|uniref:Uncharacterized protein n=1 Tax=Acinetobacter rongchengensis TaxID=2419601 RepID=A0A3A8F230_9GAMM|nr:hypothetical protein D7V20_04170 [Acinetobacter rongchengensis]
MIKNNKGTKFEEGIYEKQIITLLDQIKLQSQKDQQTELYKDIINSQQILNQSAEMQLIIQVIRCMHFVR